MNEQKKLCKLGKVIRKYRHLSGLSQEALSEIVGCDKNTIGRIERGETDFKISIMLRLAEGLDVSISRLSRELDSIQEDSYAASIEYDYLRLYQYCRKLSPEQFSTICNTAYIFAKGNHSSNT